MLANLTAELVCLEIMEDGVSLGLCQGQKSVFGFLLMSEFFTHESALHIIERPCKQTIAP